MLSAPGHRQKRMQTARATAAGKQIKGHLLGKMIPNNVIIWTVERRKTRLKKKKEDLVALTLRHLLIYLSIK